MMPLFQPVLKLLILLKPTKPICLSSVDMAPTPSHTVTVP